MSAGIVIVGGGQAAASAAAKIREIDAEISVTMVCEEPVLPYQRPPLSKKYLSGEMPLERLILRPQDWFDDHKINVLLGERVQSIDAVKKLVKLGNETSLPYDKLLLATGSAARRLPAAIGGDLEGVHYLRTRADADGLRPVLETGGSVLIVGGGYIGLEAAAVIVQTGASVIVVEMGERILQRVASAATADYFRSRHLAEGVQILEGVGLEKLISEDGRVTGASLTNGSELSVDSVLCGIGIFPCDELAKDAGLTLENGISVDSFCRTSNDDIYAAGDCASFEFRGTRIRLESVPNAINQAETAVENMLGAQKEYIATPWFWSDQYDVKLQIAGLNTGYDNTIVRPGKREGAQSVWYYKGEQLLAVDAMNDAPAFMVARRILEAGKSVPPALAGDPAVNLKDFL